MPTWLGSRKSSRPRPPPRSTSGCLLEVFPDLKLGLLHGRMSSKDKDKVMRRFRDGDLDILVSTAVVEVGIDVANATVMMIEGSDRFGLAQLHQFRGRVGRGEHKSYCILMSDSPSDVAKERLSALEEIHDGFRLAEVDLELQGAGRLLRHPAERAAQPANGPPVGPATTGVGPRSGQGDGAGPATKAKEARRVGRSRGPLP